MSFWSIYFITQWVSVPLMSSTVRQGWSFDSCLWIGVEGLVQLRSTVIPFHIKFLAHPLPPISFLNYDYIGYEVFHFWFLRSWHFACRFVRFYRNISELYKYFIKLSSCKNPRKSNIYSNYKKLFINFNDIFNRKCRPNGSFKLDILPTINP